MKISIVYPTRDRPDIIEKALYFLEQQTYTNFEVIISDNYSDEKFSCLEICNNSKLDVIYVHPQTDLNMTENWNYAMEFVTGDYISCLTDKMFLLPNTLRKCVDVLKEEIVDILTWRNDTYSPLDPQNYYAMGNYYKDINPEIGTNAFKHYSPKEYLRKKSSTNVCRLEQSRSLYCSGKICFGLYSKELIEKIIKKYDKLYYDLSPDYTAMISALLLAKNAVELKDSGVVYLNSEVSNGNMCKVNDEAAFNFLTRSPISLESSNYLIPGLYSSQHNIVIHDYLFFVNTFNSDIEINTLAWCINMYEDISNPRRYWSDQEVKRKQFEIFNNYIKEFSISDKIKFYQTVYLRKIKHFFINARSGIISFASRFTLLLKFRKLIKNRTENNLSSIDEILTKNLYYE